MEYGARDQLQGYGTTRFAYDGAEISSEWNWTPSTATLLRRYMPGPGVDETVVWYEGTGTSDRRWLHADERGSVVAVSDGSGAMLAINRYDEYGIPQSGNAGRFQYTGQAWLAELGIQYSKARMYSPTLGRFMQTDPIGYAGGLNWYDYVHGDPVNFSDPSGLCVQVAGPDGVYSPPAVCPPPRTPWTPSGIRSPFGDPRTSNADAIALFFARRQLIPILIDMGIDRNLAKRKLAATPQNKQEQSFTQCALNAAKKNAGTLALDAVSVGASFVPGGKGLVTAGAAVVGSTTGVAGIGLGIANHDATGASIGAAGHYTSVATGLLDGAKGVAGYLPVAGQALAIGGLLYDGYNALKDGGCLGGGK